MCISFFWEVMVRQSSVDCESFEIGGWGVSPTGKSYSFRSCVRACEAACAREAMLFPRLGCGSSNNAPASSSRALCLSVGHVLVQRCRWSRLPGAVGPACCAVNLCRSLLINAKSVLIDCKSFLVARCFSLLPAAFRLKECKSMCLVPGAVGLACFAVNLCKSQLINCKSFFGHSCCFSLRPAAFIG